MPGSSIQRSLDAYGKEGEKNAAGQNVVIGFSNSQKNPGTTQRVNKDTISVTFRADFVGQASANPDGYTAVVGHEGVHVADGAPEGLNREPSEVRAYQVNQDLYEGLGSNARFSKVGILWNPENMGTDTVDGLVNRIEAAWKFGLAGYKEDLEHDNEPQ